MDKSIPLPKIGEHRYRLRNDGLKWYQLKYVETIVSEISTVQSQYGVRVEVFFFDADGCGGKTINADDVYAMTFATEQDAKVALKRALRQTAQEEKARAERYMEGE